MTPNEQRNAAAGEIGGFLNDRGDTIEAEARLRVYPCHEFKGNHGRALIEHTGWYSCDDGDGDLIFGIVGRLPHGRGFLAGWSMGASMTATLSRRVYDSERDAVYAADSAADRVAETEREYQRKWRGARDCEDLAEQIQAARAEHSALCAELPCARLSHDVVPQPHTRRAIIARLSSLRARVRTLGERRRALIELHGDEIIGPEFN